MNRLAGCLALCSSIVFGTVSAADWPHLRGPALDGSTVSGGALSGERVELELAWTAPIGSGYSGIVAADDRVVTMYSADGTDWVAAHEAKSGKVIWRHSLGDAYPGRDGADDGPLSSPLIDEGRVHALGPRGTLYTLRLDDGKELWQVKLTTEFGSIEPDFGFTTTPLVEGKVLILQTGGPRGKAISGLDKKTGRPVWSLGDDKVDYQSPATLTLAGQRQVVAVSGKRLQGIEPSNGKILWSHDLGEEAYVESASPTPAGTDRFLIFSRGEAVVFELGKSSDGFGLKEVFRTKDLGGTYALPVFHDGHLYGFRNQFLSCVNADSGELVWKSRPPGGRGLILVDGHLVVFGAEGNVVVAEATPAGYREQAKLKVLEGSGYTWPSFAADRIYVRNLDTLVAVTVTAGSAGDAPESVGATPAADHDFGRWVASVESSADAAAMIDEFMKRHEQLPVVEGNWVHFIYRGEVTDIAVFGTMIPTANPDAMTRIAGTDLYHASYELQPAGRWEYTFVVDYDQRVPDPHNPRTAPSLRGDERVSVVTTAGYVEPSYLGAADANARGTLETVQFDGEKYGDARELTVYLPRGYADGDRAYPLLIVHEGPDWLEKGLMVNSLDNLIGTTITPLVAVFVPPADEWWLEAGGSQTDAYARMLAEELVPWLSQKFRLIDEAQARAVMGSRNYGLAAAYVAWRYPRVFGNVAVQSVALGLGAEAELFGMIERADGDPKRVYLDWNRYEYRNPDSGVDIAADNRRLAEVLERSGTPFSGGEVLDSYGWGGWRARTDRLLATFFPTSRQ
ncbi:MAG TPA: PQQ-binding-like beta-propeller repeat protein [Candidatus Polarisedimenticolaceae bacterium]|nr:PQQ-binding-like beta-propeller repeat protein [Candidatus Polarisedimenticolaceae bacterium]